MYILKVPMELELYARIFPLYLNQWTARKWSGICVHTKSIIEWIFFLHSPAIRQIVLVLKYIHNWIDYVIWNKLYANYFNCAPAV